MHEYIRNMASWLIDFAKLLLADIDESKMGMQPVAGMNTPRWILGHLCVTTDFAGQLLGAEPSCPPEWMKSFGPGSDPATAPAVPKAELLATFERTVTVACAASETATRERLERPNPFEPAIPPAIANALRKAFPTAGHMAVQVLVGHSAMHLGQLSAWRRVVGLKGVLGV